MKKLFLMLLMSVGAFVYAQTTNNAEFVKAVDQLNTAKDYQQLSMIETELVKGANSQKSWHSYYYTAMLNLKKAQFKLNEGKKENVVGDLETALKYLRAGEAKEKNNVEIIALLGIVNHLKSIHSTNSMEVSKKEAKKYYSQANGLDSKNERVKLLGQLLNNSVVKNNKAGDQIIQKSLVPVWNVEFLGNLIKKN